ncbi:MAG: LD-carboxypeptidase [Nitrospiria bacterium]
MKKPEALKKGDAIGVVAPAGSIAPGVLKKGIERLRKLGFQVVEGRHLGGSFRYFSGTDQQRAEDLAWMFRQDVRAIVCARGGYGSSRLIPHLKDAHFMKSDKIFIGCSDITTLLLYFSRLKIPVFHGPMISHFSRSDDSLSDHFLTRMLTSPEPMGRFSFPETQILREGAAEGRLTGGCLSLICSSLGTCYEIETKGKILLIEEVNEAPYRIDRMLTQLKLAGKLKGVKGILFGTFVHCDPSEGSNFKLSEIIGDCIGDLKCPIFFGLPFGHGNQNITLPYGLKVKMDSDARTVDFVESPVK